LLSGHGQSTEVLRDSSWSAWYASIVDAHDELRRHCNTIIVGGLSAGGVMTLRLAAERSSQIAGIALFAPTLWPNGWAVPWYFNFMKLFLHKWSANLVFLAERTPYGFKDQRLRNLLVSSTDGPAAGGRRLGFYGGTIMEFRWMVAAVQSCLASIRQPTLIIHPREDDRSSLANAAKIAKGLGGPVDLTVLTDSYHMCTLDRQRDVVVERTLSFISQTVAAVAAAENAPRKRSANE
jgi:carboxylesterase